MKRYLALFCALCCPLILSAQPSEGAASHTAAAPPTETDKTELMLRRLREALTNRPASATPASPAPVAPPVRTPGVTEPIQQTPAPDSVQQPLPAPGVITRPARETTGSALPASTNVITLPPAATPPGRRVIPSRSPSMVDPLQTPGRMAPQMPGAQLPGAQIPGPQMQGAQGSQLPVPQVPGGQINLPGAPATLPDQRTNIVTVAANLDPSEIIPAGTIQVQGMDPDQFFDIYAQVSGRTVIRGYTLPNLQKITLKAATDWTRQEAVFAMDAVMAQNKVAMIPIGDKFVKAVPAADAPTEGAEPSKVQASHYGEAEPFITQVIELKVVKPTELQQLLSTFTKTPQGITPFDATQTLVIRDYASNVKRMLEVIRSVDVAPKEPDYRLEVIPVKYGKVIDLYDTMQALISGGGVGGSSSATGQGGVGQGNISRLGGRSGAGRLGGTGYGGYGGYGGGGYGGYGGYGGGYGRSYGGYGSGSMYPYEESVERLSPMQATTPQPTTTTPRTSVGGAQASFQSRLNQIVRRAASGTGEEVMLLEEARIVADERSNTLLVFANKRDMEMITNIVAKVDVLLAQVLIEAVIMEVRLGDSQKLGFSWAQRPKDFGGGVAGAGGINNSQPFLNNITNFPGGLSQGFSYFGTLNNQWEMAINAVAENSSIDVVSRPRIQTSHAIPGSFFVGETVPYITGFTDYGGLVGAGVATRSVVQQANVGFSLFVTPFITPDGFVVMEISQEFSTRGRDVLIDNNPVPIINGRNADSVLTVRDGDTIMMGGFITENRSRAKSGVPFLKDIPGLGALFRSKTDSNERNELIVLMRARVLRSPEQAAIVATQERKDLPGISEAEKYLERDEQYRRQRATQPRR